jgi:hypothetical protein
VAQTMHTYVSKCRNNKIKGEKKKKRKLDKKKSIGKIYSAYW